MKKKLLAILILCITVFSLTACDSSDYKKAMSLYESGDYEEAAKMFVELGDYEDSAEMAVKAKEELMYVTYADVFEALKQETWYFNGGSDTILNYLTFADKEANLGQVYFDGNGKHDNGSNACSYIVDDVNVTITMVDGTELAIPYEMKDSKVVLDKDYVSSTDVKAGIVGYWKTRYSQTILGNTGTYEDNIYIGEDSLEYEHACTAYGYSNGEYYYYGPYTGTYTLGVGSFETEMKHGHEWFFNIIDGKVVVLHYTHVCTPSDKLPGEDGYSFK